MVVQRRKPGEVRDAILDYLHARRGEASVAEIRSAVTERLGAEVSASSVRSYLNINTPAVFERRARGRYALRKK